MKKLTIILQIMLAVLPVSLLAGAHFLEGQLWLCPVFSALYVLLAGLCVHIPGKKRVLAGLLCAALLIAAGVWLVPWRIRWPSAFLPLLYVVLLFATLPIGGWPKEQELSVTISFAGLAGYILMQFLLLTGLRSLYGSTAPMLLAGFLAYLVLWLLMLNRVSLYSAASATGRAPASMRRKNTLLTLGFTVLILFIAAIPALAEWLAMVWNYAKETLLAILRWIASLIPQSESTAGGSGGGGDMFAGLGEASEPSALAKFLEKVAIVLAIVLAAALVIWAGRILWRKLRVLLRKLWALISRYTLAASEDYVDEISDTREEGGDTSTSRRRALRRRLRQINEAELSPNERIRYRYQRLLWKRTDWGRSSTARENLAQENAGLYEKARYSSTAVTAEEAEQFAAYSRTLEKSPRNG